MHNQGCWQFQQQDWSLLLNILRPLPSFLVLCKHKSRLAWCSTTIIIILTFTVESSFSKESEPQAAKSLSAISSGTTWKFIGWAKVSARSFRRKWCQWFEVLLLLNNSGWWLYWKWTWLGAKGMGIPYWTTQACAAEQGMVFRVFSGYTISPFSILNRVSF